MGIAEIAQRAGVSRQTVAQWHVRKKLPEPDARLAMGPVWRETTIEAWIADNNVPVPDR
jgi:predicted DNA-binding transcriptional regulator AlpA